MDAHLFRRLAHEISAAVCGARIEQFYCPASDVTTLVFYAAGLKQNLLLRAGRRFPLLFLSAHRPENPDTPAAHAMWLRKHASGKRLGQAVIDWGARCMAFPLSGVPVRWLVLSLRDGVTIVDSLPDDFGVLPEWPDHSMFADILNNKNVWEQYPQYTPLLRETLAELAETDPMDARALLVDLEYGPGTLDGEVYLYTKVNQPTVVSVWPLSVRQSMGATETVVSSAMEAAALAGQPALFGTIVRTKEAHDAAPAQAALKRARKTLAKLDAEELRLQGMIAGQADALALQGELWRLGPDVRLDTVAVMTESGMERQIVLNPLLSVRENMEYLFKQAARGRRGIGMLNDRRSLLRGQIDALERGEVPALSVKQSVPAVARKAKKKSAEEPGNKLFQRFRSSDGFTMLRGKNAKGNHEILNKVMPHDLWFHAEDGPSAHLVLKLEFPEQEVPERTMQEAAMLVGLKSWQREGGQARVMCALAKNVRKVKGAAVGAVHVSRMERSLLVDLLPDLERMLTVGEHL